MPKSITNARSAKKQTKRDDSFLSDSAKRTQIAKSACPAASGKVPTKTAIVLSMLQSEGGTTVAAIMAATNWQAHSVRGFLSAIVKKTLKLTLVKTRAADGTLVYRIDGDIPKGEPSLASKPQATLMPGIMVVDADEPASPAVTSPIGA